MRKSLVAWSFLLAALLPQGTGFAHGYSKSELGVRHPWTRATAPAAERVELHVMLREGDVVRMREVKSLDVPARERLILRPSGSHLMIVGLGKPLVKGDRVPLTLRFEKAGELQIELEVQALDSRKAHH